MAKRMAGLRRKPGETWSVYTTRVAVKGIVFWIFVLMGVAMLPASPGRDVWGKAVAGIVILLGMVLVLALVVLALRGLVRFALSLPERHRRGVRAARK